MRARRISSWAASLVCAAVLAVLWPAAARAQSPGQTPPQQAVPPPPGGAPYHPAPPMYGPPLTPEEQRLLARGEIGPELAVAGGMVGTFMGFGLGHAVQGRYSDRGWLFTVGEVGSMVMLFAGLANCFEYDAGDGSCTMSTVGIIGLVGFRVWELVDVWAGPVAHNRKVEDLRLRTGYMPPPRYGFYALPRGKDGASLGLTLRF